MQNPTFSIITTTHADRAKLLKRAARSVFNQTFNDFEWIIIDDGSIDNTKEVVASFSDKRIVFESFPENRGVNMARNRGLDLANGKYIVFLDSDDELLPGALQTFFNLWKKVKDDKIGGITTRCIDGKTKKKVGWWKEDNMILDYKGSCGKKKRGEAHSCWRRDAIGKERFEEGVIGCSLIFIRRLRKKWKSWCVDVPTRIYHRDVNRPTLTSKMIENAPKMTAGYEILIKENKEFWQENCPEQYHHYLNSAALRYLFAGNKKRARELLRITLKEFPFSVASFILYLLSFTNKYIVAELFKLKERIVTYRI
jgi:glycosyltransferase involved in cell wall biosynthesis